MALADFFGRKTFATLMGIMSTCSNIGMLVSPIYAGWLFDKTNSYVMVLLTFAPLYGLSGLLYLIMRKPASPRRQLADWRLAPPYSEIREP